MAKKEAESVSLVDAIAVKYRPRTFSDMVGNEKNMDIIRGYFARRKLVKSWGMFGPSGSGKSTTARILAMAANCQNLSDNGDPCLECSSCKMALTGTHVDIREVNAGSEEGKVSGIESLLTTISYKPRFNARVVIIDECHLASGKAMQSLLKAVEEPPKGVMFILCTTNPEKLPKAMLGRCVKMYFEYPEPRNTAKRLYKICKKEFSEEVTAKVKPFLIPIAESTQAQVRNSLAIMESLTSIVCANPKVTKEKLKEMFNNLVLEVGDLDKYAIRYCTFMMAGNLQFPLSLAMEIETARVTEFITLALRHAQYAGVYFLYKEKGRDKFYELRRRFWGVNFKRFDEALEAIAKGRKPKDLVNSALSIAVGLIAAQEKIRTGVITSDQAIMYGITQTLRG